MNNRISNLRSIGYSKDIASPEVLCQVYRRQQIKEIDLINGKYETFIKNAFKVSVLVFTISSICDRYEYVMGGVVTFWNQNYAEFGN